MNILDRYNSETGELTIRTNGDRIITISRPRTRKGTLSPGYILRLYKLPYIKKKFSLLTVVILVDGSMGFNRYAYKWDGPTVYPLIYTSTEEHGLCWTYDSLSNIFEHKFWFDGRRN